jgi:ABC-2 type transport system permease protein
MSTLSYAVADSATMLRRQLRHMQRYLSMTLMLIGMPIVFLLLFVYVFGGTLGAGLGGPAMARTRVSGGAGGSRRRATSDRTARGPWRRNV